MRTIPCFSITQISLQTFPEYVSNLWKIFRCSNRRSFNAEYLAFRENCTKIVLFGIFYCELQTAAVNCDNNLHSWILCLTIYVVQMLIGCLFIHLNKSKYKIVRIMPQSPTAQYEPMASTTGVCREAEGLTIQIRSLNDDKAIPSVASFSEWCTFH